MKNKVKTKLIEGNSVVGTFFEIGGSTAIECLGISGLDFMIIDCEHGPFDVESSMSFIRTAELRDITPFVRTKDISRSSILKMLDIGAKGLVIPCIETVDEVKKIVEYGKYSPIGSRGFFFGRVSGYGHDDIATDIQTYFNTCNQETLLLPQCETMGCLENIETIVNLEGVDGIFIGPYDLSIAMGKPAQFGDPEFTSAIKRILSACKDAGKYAFIFSGNAKSAKEYIEEGFDGVAINTDVSVYINAFKSILKEINE